MLKRLVSGNLGIAPPHLVIILVPYIETCFLMLIFDKGKKRLVSGNLGIAPPYLVNLAFLPLWGLVIVYDNHVTLLF